MEYLEHLLPNESFIIQNLLTQFCFDFIQNYLLVS